MLAARHAELEPMRPALPWLDRFVSRGDSLETLDVRSVPPALGLADWIAARRSLLPADVGAEAVAALDWIASESRSFVHRVETLNDRLMALVRAMDFRFLYDEKRGLFAIGYNVAENRLDGADYDLLASEARLASLVAIAVGAVPVRHWFKLGRRIVTPT